MLKFSNALAVSPIFPVQTKQNIRAFHKDYDAMPGRWTDHFYDNRTSKYINNLYL